MSTDVGPTAQEAVVALTEVLGHEDDPGLAERLHELRHRDGVDEVDIEEGDLPRRRLRLTSARGTTYAVALDRGSALGDGSVLAVAGDGPQRVVVVRARSAPRLRLRAEGAAAAMRLGFLAGHLHWVCRMDDGVLEVVLQAPEQDYLDRVADLLDSGAIARAGG
ncbi:urease accessory protein UreE [Kineococcus rubinsiae]|uniref:urease accessory protein UreE n=1 Tax=Kineococcus rubinsiae TaxID=2609562 RepID=UPI001430AAEF|nr:urease accessory protein UreE [Kineococcus rubinsiae]